MRKFSTAYVEMRVGLVTNFLIWHAIKRQVLQTTNRSPRSYALLARSGTIDLVYLVSSVQIKPLPAAIAVYGRPETITILKLVSLISLSLILCLSLNIACKKFWTKSRYFSRSTSRCDNRPSAGLGNSLWGTRTISEKLFSFRYWCFTLLSFRRNLIYAFKSLQIPAKMK